MTQLSRYEYLQKIYPNIDLTKSYSLFYVENIDNSKLNYSVLHVYFTTDNKWIFELAEEINNQVGKYFYVELDEFPAEDLELNPIYLIFTNKEVKSFYWPKPFDDTLIPEEYICREDFYSDEKPKHLIHFIPFSEFSLYSSYNIKSEHISIPEILEKLENFEIPNIY